MFLNSFQKIPCLSIILVGCSIFYISAAKTSCEAPCSGGSSESDDSQLPKFQKGISYLYEYESESLTELANTNNQDKSNVSFKGHLKLSAITPCYFDLTVLTLKSVHSYDGFNESVYEKLDLPTSSIRFRYENGTILDVCTTKEDSLWSSNLKRSMISLFQVTNSESGNRNFKHTKVITDSNGICPSEVDRKGNIFFRKSDLTKCKKREFGVSVQNGIVYDANNKGFQSIPLLDSSLTCRQEYHSNILQGSLCVEENSLKPVSTKASTVKATMRTTLTFITEQALLPSHLEADTKFTPSSIFFQDRFQEPGNRTSTLAEKESLRSLLKSFCSDIVAEEISKEAPMDYGNLKNTVQYLSSEDISQFYQEIKSATICQDPWGKFEKLFLGALIQSGSDGPTEFLVKLMLSNELPQELQTTFLENLKFANRPGKLSISSMHKLLKSVTESQVRATQTDFDIVLTSSALAHQYCKLMNTACRNASEYRNIVDSIATFVQTQCDAISSAAKVSKQLFYPAILGLQSLGNLDVLTPKAVSAVSKCMTSKWSRIRIHALAAYRRDPCEPTLKSKAKSLMQSIVLGSDVRISAYLAVMRCFKRQDIQAIQRLADNDKSNQVFSYVYTHVSTQMDSASPGKRSLQSILRKVYLDRDLPKSLSSFGKYSKNIELSRFVNSQNLGASAEGSIVYSQESYIPRIMTFNVTTEFLGRSYNLLETGIYIDNFENLLSRVNAPLMITEESNEIPDTGRSSQGKNSTYTLKSEELRYITDQTKIRNRYTENGQIDIWFRRHGTTVKVCSYEQDDFLSFDQLLSLTSEMLPEKAEEFFQTMRSLVIDKAQPLTFLEEQVIVPTSAGIPLYLSFDASAILSSKYEFNVDIPALFSNEMDKEMSLKLMPNIAGLVKASMTVGPQDLFNTGFQLEGKLHLSSSADFSLDKKRNNLQIQYNFPNNRFRVFEVDTHLAWVQNGKERKRHEIASVTPIEKYVNECTDSSTASFLGFLSPHRLGLKYCYTVQVPRGISFNNFWLQGPIAFRVSSEKIDPSMKGFAVNISTGVAQDGDMGFSISYDTPGSQENRRIAIQALMADYRGFDLQFMFEYPSDQSPLKLRINPATEAAQGFEVTFTNAGGLYNAVYKILLDYDDDDNGVIVYKPLISRYASDNDQTIYLVNGTLSRVVGKSLDVDLSFTPAYWIYIPEFKGMVRARYGSDGDFEYELQDGRISIISPIFGKTPYNIALQGKLYSLDKYSDVGFKMETVVGPANADLAFETRLRLVPREIYSLDARAFSAAAPNINFDYKLLAGYTTDEESGESTIQFLTSLDKQWSISAIRKAGDSFGSLEFTADLKRINRKVVLYTYRLHEDKDNFTKFDFDAHLKWDASNDDSQQALVKLSFLYDLRDEFENVIVCTNQLNFVQRVYKADLNVKYPKLILRGDYLAHLAVSAPNDQNYGLKLLNSRKIYTSQNTTSNYLIEVEIPSAVYSVSLFRQFSVEGNSRDYVVLSSYDFKLLMGQASLLNLTLVTSFENQGSLKFLKHKVIVDAKPAPFVIQVQTDITARDRPSGQTNVDCSIEVTQSFKNNDQENRGNLLFTYKPAKFNKAESHALSVAWRSVDQSYVFLIPDFSFSTNASFSIATILDMKMSNVGGLTLSTGGYSWAKSLQISQKRLDSTIRLSSPSESMSFDLVAGTETSDSRTAIFKFASATNYYPELNLLLRLLVANPLDFTEISMKVKDIIELDVTHEKNADASYNSQLSASLPKLKSDVRISNNLQLLPTSKTTDLRYVIIVQEYLNQRGNIHAALTQSVRSEDTWEVDALYTVDNSQERLVILKLVGPVKLIEEGKLSGEFQVEAPFVLYNTSTVAMDVDYDPVSYEITKSKLNITSPHVQTEFMYFIEHVSTPHEIGTKYNYKAMSYSLPPQKPYMRNEPVQIDIKISRTNQKLGLSYDYLQKTQDTVQKRMAIRVARIQEHRGDQKSKSLQLVTTRTVTVPGEGDSFKTLNISSGFKYTFSQSKCDEDSCQVLKNSLCVVGEKNIGNFNTDFKYCTFGLTSNTTISATEKSSQTKFTLLDRIGFKAGRLETENHLSLNSSFWLDFIDKPQEELQFSLARDKVHQPARQKKGPISGLQYKFMARHPFVPRPLRVLTRITREQDTPYYNGYAEIDVFQRSIDKIICNVSLTGPATPDDDDDFDSFGDSSEVQASTSSAAPRVEKVFVSVHSQGLPVQFRLDGDASGYAYSVLTYDSKVKQGKLVFRLPTLMDGTIIQIGEEPVISVTLGGVPKLTLSSFDNTESLTTEVFLGSLYPVRFQNSYELEKNAYAIKIPKIEDEEFQIGFCSDKSGNISHVFDTTISMNTSKLLQLKFTWDSLQVISASNDISKFTSSVSSNVRNFWSTLKLDTKLNSKFYVQKVVEALPTIRPLLDKLDREFQEDLEEIRRDPHSFIVYKKLSDFILETYIKAKTVGTKVLTFGRFAIRSVVHLSRVASEMDYYEKFKEIAASLFDCAEQILNKIVEEVNYIRENIRQLYEIYLMTIPDYVKAVQAFKEIVNDIKNIIQQIIRNMIYEVPIISTYIEQIVPKEAHDFLRKLKDYSLDSLYTNDMRLFQNNIPKTNVTYEDVVSSGYIAGLKIGTRFLESKGFMLRGTDSSLLLQFPLWKPIRNLRQLSTLSKTHGLKPGASPQDWIRWAGDFEIGDSRSSRWAKIYSKLDAALLGGIGPDDSIGLVIGNNLYRTFDGRFHRLDSHCPYLLASDFLTGNTTVHINGPVPSNQQRPVFLTTDDHTAAILDNSTVEYQGEYYHIPLTDLSLMEFQDIGPFTALRYDSGTEVVELTKKHSGFTIACLTSFPVCVIRLEEYLYGRALGLLGTNNRENFDDFLTPSGEIVGKTSGFYKSWRLDRECKETSGTSTRIEISAKSKAAEKHISEECEKMFSGSYSPLRSCFSTVNPTEFEEVCNSFALSQEQNVNSSVCTIGAAYWVQCREEGVRADEFLDACLP